MVQGTFSLPYVGTPQISSNHFTPQQLLLPPSPQYLLHAPNEAPLSITAPLLYLSAYYTASFTEPKQQPEPVMCPEACDVEATCLIMHMYYSRYTAC